MTVTAAPAPAQDERLKSVNLWRGREEVIVNLDRVGDHYEVSAVRLYWAGANGRVQGTMERKFTGEDAHDRARDYANGYWAFWTKKGFRAR